MPAKKRVGRDERKRQTVAEAVNLTALRKTKVISAAAALKRASVLLLRTEGLTARPRVDYTTVDVSNKKGKLLSRTRIDTTVTYSFSLGGVPVVGPGAKQRVAFAGDGSVIQLSQAVRKVAQAGAVPIISPDDALKQCVGLYGPRIKQAPPTLSYYAPPLGAVRASGAGIRGPAAAALRLPAASAARQGQADRPAPPRPA